MFKIPKIANLQPNGFADVLMNQKQDFFLSKLFFLHRPTLMTWHAWHGTASLWNQSAARLLEKALP